LNLNKNEKEELEKYFNRKTLKKTIMTEPYGVGRKKAYSYFIKDIKINNNSSIKIEEIEKKFNSFFNFLKNNNITKNNSSTITEYIIKKSIITLKDRSIVNFKYHKKDIEVRKDTTINNKRSTIQW
jgi:hypothetical protein